MDRPDGRAIDEIRPVSFQPDIAAHAHGSVLVSFGDTQVICAAMISDGVPRWMFQQNVPGGWLTAEYNMLPYSCLERKPRDISRGKIDGRSSEIQRLIGRSLRAVVDLKGFGQRTLWIDCDVLRADGGTRTASITGACVAVEMAFMRFQEAGMIKRSPVRQLAAAISAGVWEDTCILDLNYPEDKDAAVDFNYAMTESLELIEVQGSGEEAVFTEAQMLEMLRLGKKGVAEICALQRETLGSFDPSNDSDLLDRIRKGRK
ncbi:MAG: ribonuclease PH [Verrucomicrobiales bacterium]|nr:ribonuclease PH [Verrucomicrobiales bacterium]